MIYRAEQLRPWVLTGPAPVEFSPYGDESAVLLDLASVPGEAEAQALARWLPTLVCPVIGLRNPDLNQCREPVASLCAQACDVVVDSLADGELLLQRIAANPVAATSFVELLRVTEGLSVAAGLSVESSVYASLQGGAEYARWLEKNRVAEPAVLPDQGPAVLHERVGRNLHLTLNRPSNLNAMSVEMRDALVDALRLIMLDELIEEVHLFGRGRSFSTGGDLAEFGQVPDAASGHIIRMLSVPGKFLNYVADRVHAHVHGACVGSGIEFPAFAGRVVAHPKAWFALPEVSMGLIPGAGGCISIARRIGRQRLAWMGLSGKRVRAPLALAWGLVDEISE